MGICTGQAPKRKQYIPGGHFEMSFAIAPGKAKSFIQVINLGFNGAVMLNHYPLWLTKLPLFGRLIFLLDWRLGKGGGSIFFVL